MGKSRKYKGKGRNNEKAIYGTGSYTGSSSFKYRLRATNTRVTCMKSEWLISYNVKEDEDKFIISATMTSRYLFSDTLKLYVYLEHEGKELKVKHFQLNKNSKKQEFEVEYDDDKPIYEISLYAIVNTSAFAYYSNTWATEESFKVSGRTHDVVIVVGDTKFYLLKNYLATWSKFFDRLFFGDFREKNQEEIQIKEVEAAEFDLVMQLIHPQFDTLKESNVLNVLKLADRFEIPHLTVRCGVMLSVFNKCKDVTLMDRLELGDKHSLIHLQVACFERIHKMPAQERINFFDENRDRIKDLSEKTAKNLL